MKRVLRHSRVDLALHGLREGEGRPLLLLHGLGERSPRDVPAAVAPWPGPIYALDFTGHGESALPRGGGYTGECLLGDADAAISELGHVTLRGRGLGAWVALLAAGARPDGVRGAILSDGPGLAGGGARPGSPVIPYVDPGAAAATPDPFALVELSRDIRPPEYATAFARLATELSGLPRALSVCAVERPDWLRAVLEEPGVETATLAAALAYHSAS
ncbi:MAG TPA: alpha/beta hydrolase [Myxococcota bacterium]|nr:alpha/beta hydrolase [Myxococcota bacterium]